MIRREPHAVDQELPPVERAQVPWSWVAQTDDPQQLLRGRIDHRDRVRGLVREIHAVMCRDRNIRRAGVAWRLAGVCRGGQQQTECKGGCFLLDAKRHAAPFFNRALLSTWS